MCRLAVTTLFLKGPHDAYDKMFDLASKQPGFLRVEAAGYSMDITVSYRAALVSINNCKANFEHQQEQNTGQKVVFCFLNKYCKNLIRLWFLAEKQAPT